MHSSEAIHIRTSTEILSARFKVFYLYMQIWLSRSRSGVTELLLI